MADETTAKTETSREEFASYLREIADAFDGEGEANIAVENKTVTVRPASVVEQEITVGERSPMIGSNTESVTIEASWTPEE